MPSTSYWIIFLIFCFGRQVSSTRQISMANKHFKIGAQAWPPLLVIKQNLEGANTISGPVGDYLEYIGKARNCSFTIVTPSDGKWGQCNGADNCTGVIGLVARKEVDFAINPFTLTQDRREAVDFTRPVLTEGQFEPIGYRVVIPVKSKSKMWYFINPFTQELWFLYIWTIPVCFLAMILVNFFCHGLVKWEATASFILRIALIEHSPATQGHTKKYQQKLLIIILVWSFMVLTYSYAGMLTAMLAKPQLQSPIKTLDELLDQNKVPWVIEAGGFVETLMRAAAPGSVTNKLLERSTRMSLKVSSSGCYSAEIEKDGRFGAICAVEDFKTLTTNDFSRTGKCNYYPLQQKFLQSWVSLAVPVRLALLSYALGQNHFQHVSIIR